LFGVMAVAEWSRSRLLVRSGVRLDRVLSTRVFNATFEAYLNQSSAQPGRSFSDLTEIRQFLTGQGTLAFFDTPWTPVYLAVLFFLHPFLGAVAIVFALLQACLAWLGHRTTVAPTQRLVQLQSEEMAFVQAKLRNTEVVESMGMLAGLRARWQDRHQDYMQQHGLSHGLSHKVMAWSKWLRYSQQSLSLGAGALLVIDGQLTPGGMIAANVLMTRALAPIDMMVGTWRAFLGARTAFERLESLLLLHPPRDAALTQSPPRGELELRSVSAHAEGRTVPILKEVSCRVMPGTVTVVLGPSGSGKSTLARVMLGIWPNVTGEVLLDARPIETWDRSDLGSHVGYLPQDIELFDGSIADNIARFQTIDSQRVIEAAQMAGLHQVILRFPKGYDTPIGEAGQLLSGGQRQRLGLARAVYGQPELVVLDEPNANLDDVGEQALLQAVQALKVAGKTVVLITHRPGVLSIADFLWVLRDGVLWQQGPRDEVLAALKARA